MSSSPNNYITRSYKWQEAILRCSLSDIDPSLGELVQHFERSDEIYKEYHDDTRSYWESIFRIYTPDGSKTMNARSLDQVKREKIWERVFELKDTFMRDERPDVVILRVKHPFPPERRVERYREHYSTWLDYHFHATGRAMYLERK